MLIILARIFFSAKKMPIPAKPTKRTDVKATAVPL
jgi:hypothetical protein